MLTSKIIQQSCLSHDTLMSSSPDCPENSSAFRGPLGKSHAIRATTKSRARMPRPKPKPNARPKSRCLSPHIPQQLSFCNGVLSASKLLGQTTLDGVALWLHALLADCSKFRQNQCQYWREYRIRALENLLFLKSWLISNRRRKNSRFRVFCVFS